MGSFNRNTGQLFKVAGTFHVPQPQEKQRFSQLAGRHTECACYFLNGIAFIRVPVGRRGQRPTGWIPTRGALLTWLNECAILNGARKNRNGFAVMAEDDMNLIVTDMHPRITGGGSTIRTLAPHIHSIEPLATVSSRTLPGIQSVGIRGFPGSYWLQWMRSLPPAMRRQSASKKWWPRSRMALTVIDSSLRSTAAPFCRLQTRCCR